MNAARMNRFLPDYALPPGELIAEYLEHLGMTRAEFFDRTGLPEKTVDDLLEGKKEIAPESASILEEMLGRPAHFWIALDRQYQNDTARIAGRKSRKPVAP